MLTGQRRQFTMGILVIVALGLALIGSANSSEAASSLTQPKGGHASAAQTPAATASAATGEPGSTRTDDKGISQVWVPAGCFDMGTDPSRDLPLVADELPQHHVCISKGFWLDQYEVTNDAFDQFVQASGYTTQSYWSKDGWNWVQNNRNTVPAEETQCFSDPKQPRVLISWYEAEAYAHWRGGRLPTEAEWEYADRGPKNFIYPWGDDYQPDNLNAEKKVGHTTDVGSYEDGKSWVNAYDMAGASRERVT